MLENRTSHIERTVVNGVEWIYNYKDPPQDAIPFQRLSPPFYMGTYKCSRCGHTWSDCGTVPPLDSVPCRITGCATPPLGILGYLLRQIRGNQVTGVGRLVKVTVEAWKASKNLKNAQPPVQADAEDGAA